MFSVGQKVTVWSNPNSPHIIAVDEVCITDSDIWDNFSLVNDPGPNFKLSDGKHCSSNYTWVTPWEPEHDIIIEREELAYDLSRFNYYDANKISLDVLKQIYELVFPNKEGSV